MRYLVLVFLITGCSTLPQHKAWVSVEKAPMRVILVDNEKDIDPQDVCVIVDKLKDIKYEDYQFNDSTSISVNYDATATQVSNVEYNINKGE